MLDKSLVKKFKITIAISLSVSLKAILIERIKFIKDQEMFHYNAFQPELVTFHELKQNVVLLMMTGSDIYNS